MVAFGKRLRESQVQEWKRYYINYKLLKRHVKHYIQQNEAGSENQKNVFKDFSKMLDNQIEKTVLFVLEQEGLYATQLSHLGQQCDALLRQQDGSKISELREAYRSVGRDLLRLLHFVEMNAIAVRKILKKIDKRLGYNFTNYYVNTRANHPYSQLQQVFKQVGIAAVIGTLSRKLAELQQFQGSYVSIYDQPALSNPDPVIDSIRTAINKISSSTNFLSYLAKHAFITEDELQTPSEDHDLDERYHFVSFFLNLANTFLYTVNVYVIVPTADEYSLSLGAAATVCGVVIGSMGVAQLFSSVFFSAWSNKSYLGPLIFSSVALLLGNTLYALAYDLNSISVLLVGRLFCGLGSARAINRRYITDCVPHKLRMQASAGFVSASALGMACAPALACMLQTKFKIWNITFNVDTLPGWVMAFAWLVYLVWLWIAFIEPPCVVKADIVQTEGNAGSLLNDAVENGCTQSLVLNVSSTQQDEDGDEECDSDDDDDEDYCKEPGKPVTSLVAAYRLLTPYVKVHLFIYFMLKYATEILLAESSVITGYYFLWSTTAVSIFLVCLGLTVLPANVFIGNYLSNIFQERQILVACEITVCIGILLSFNILVPYSVPQYVCSAFITFVSAEVLEGVNLSLLSRVMPSRLSRGTYNGGLLSTEAGTLARVVAGGTVTVVGYLGEDWLLNATLLPSICICALSIATTCFTYNSLS